MTAPSERDPLVQELSQHLAELGGQILLEMRKEPVAAFLTDQALGALASRAAAAAAAYSAPVVRTVAELGEPIYPLAKPLHFCGGCGNPVEQTPTGRRIFHKPTCKGDQS